MARFRFNKGSDKELRQEWNPHWLLKLLYTVISAAWSVLKVALGAAVTVALILLICMVVFVGTLGDYLQNDILTEAADWSIDDYDLENTSFIYYVDGDGNIQQLQQIYTTTDRQWAPLDEIPQALVDATVAIEDKRFYEHQGVDWITTVKACANMFFGGDSQFGGSTITQQLVKNVSQEKSITVQRKVMEIFRAQLFERKYSKDLIMEEYLNRIYLGKGCYGVKSAAAAYFGKELRDLTTAECASLISITNNPSLFNPYSQSAYMYKGAVRNGEERNRYRQLNVLREMRNQGYLTESEYQEAIQQEMVFKEGIELEERWTKCDNINCDYEGTVATYLHEGDAYFCPRCGTQTYVSVDASQHIYSWFVDAVILDVASDLAAMDGVDWENAGEATRNYYLERIQKGGYHIYTTLDMKVQNQVDKIYQDLSNMPKTRSTQQLQSAIVIIDNRTGDIVALSGGVGEKTDFLAYNKATQAKLQTGSAQKPISVYAPAFEKGTVSPVTVLKDLPVNYDDGAYPKNDSKTYKYSRTVYGGVVSSINTISVRTLMTIGEEYGFSFAKYNFGLSNLQESYKLANGKTLTDVALSPLAMGALTVGATVREMTAAYATFANDGVYRTARTYTKVYNSNGDLVINNEQESRKILSEKTVDYMNYCLVGAANNGTGTAAVFPGQTVAGKTGTTSSNKDRWFCGYTKHYTGAVWVGYNKPEQIYLLNGYANPAARLWRQVMEPIHKGLTKKALYNGNKMQVVSICLDSGLLATAACQNDARGLNRAAAAACYQEDVPDRACNKHILVNYCVTGGGIANDFCISNPYAQVEPRGVVCLTPEEVSEMSMARRYGLQAEYASGNYICVEDGVDVSGALPYAVCTEHTSEYVVPGYDFED